MKPLPPPSDVGGIHIPEMVRERPNIATIVARHRHAPADFILGSAVYLARYAGVEVVFDGEPYIVVAAEDVLLVKEADVANL